MKYLLLTTLVFYALTSYWAYKLCDRSGDDLGAIVPFIAAALVSVVLTVGYVVVALWTHHFL